MARIPYVDVAELPQDVRRVLEELPGLNLFRMMAHAQTAFPGAIALGAAILGRLELDASLREFAILETARSTGVGYEWNQHADAARAVGITQDQIDAVGHGMTDAECFSERERCVLALARCLTLTTDIPDDLFEAASVHFPPRQLVELTLVVGFYRMLGGLLRGLRVDLDAPDGGGLLEYSAGR